jgi:dihydroorotate dehydrogenase (NAD+) catalytic subunit
MAKTPATTGGNGRAPDLAGTEIRTELCGIRLRHPVINGSGTFDAIAARRAFGEELWRQFPFSAFVSKTITPEPRPGNPPPRIYEVGHGMVNSIGLPNKGLDGFLTEDLPLLAELPVPLIVSVMATSHGEFARLVEGVSAREEVAALELNVSCPNVESGLLIGGSAEETGSLLERLRPLTEKPLIVKLTPNVEDPAPIAAAAEAAGADAVSLINTVQPEAPPEGFWLGSGSGGLSGPAIAELARDQVSRVAHRVSVPVVAMGGVASGRDAAGLLAAGARVVAVGTESFRDPAAGSRIAAELAGLPVRSVT